MILSDTDLRAAVESGRLGIDPFDPAAIQPASIDVHLDHRFRVPRSHKIGVLDVKVDHAADFELVEADDHGGINLMPGEFMLASTRERVRLGDDLVARLEGKSSLARLGLIIHAAGFIDPGFDGAVTLELANLTPMPIRLYAGMPVGQLAVTALSSPAAHPYGTGPLRSKYQGQDGPTPSAFWRNFVG